jgi:hypothetical protein
MLRIKKINKIESQEEQQPKTIKEYFNSIKDLIVFEFGYIKHKIIFHIALFDSVEINFSFKLLCFTIDLPEKINKLLWHEFYNDFLITKHKVLETLLSIEPIIGFGIHFESSIHNDLSGMELHIYLLCFEVRLTVYDCRDWNDEKNSWEQ